MTTATTDTGNDQKASQNDGGDRSAQVTRRGWLRWSRAYRYLRPGPTRDGVCAEGIGVNSAGNVFNALLAHGHRMPDRACRHVFLHPRRDANPTRFGQAFKTGSDIDAVAENIAVLDNDISDIDADPELDPLRDSDAGIPDGHRLLHVGRTAQAVYHAAELNEKTHRQRS